MGKKLAIISIVAGIFLILLNGMSSLENPITGFLILLGFFGIGGGIYGLYRDSMKKNKIKNAPKPQNDDIQKLASFFEKFEKDKEKKDSEE